MNYDNTVGEGQSPTTKTKKTNFIYNDSGVALINQLFADHFKSVRINKLSQSELTKLKKSVETGNKGGEFCATK